MSPDWTDTCGFTGPTVPLMTEAVGQSGPIGTDPWAVGVAGQQRTRLIFLDISGPDPQHTAMIVITARNQATFDSFIDDAMQVVSTFHFK